MENTPAGPVDWGRIHAAQFVFEDQCWTTCDGGFCCKHDHPDFQFQLIPIHGSTITYMEDEFEWLSRNGAVPGPATTNSTPNVLSFDFGGPRPLAIVHAFCGLLGRCGGVIHKPLLCRVYPMLPILGTDGELEDIYPSSIFELTMELIHAQSPCTVLLKKKQYHDRWKSASQWLDCLRHPYVILYLQAAKHFTDIYRMKFESNTKLKGLSGKEFWKRWELLYLSGQLIDAGLLAERVRSSHDALAARFGPFLAPAEKAPARELESV